MPADWDAFADFMRSVEAARLRFPLRPDQECFYRGHTHQRYTLLPSLFRLNHETDLWKLERRLFFEFRARARQLYVAHSTDWDVLFHMQHHAMPTRLLDWTSVFGVALYFALLGYREGGGYSPCIWILNPYAMNHAAWDVYRLFDPRYLARDEHLNRSYEFGEFLLETKALWDKPLAIYPIQKSERMFAQNGWFTIHGVNRAPLEEIFGYGDDSGILNRVDIPVEAIPAAQVFLELAGIGHRQLFPDLDGLTRSMKQKFRL
jgi:hypothetical protein